FAPRVRVPLLKGDYSLASLEPRPPSSRKSETVHAHSEVQHMLPANVEAKDNESMCQHRSGSSIFEVSRAWDGGRRTGARQDPPNWARKEGSGRMIPRATANILQRSFCAFHSNRRVLPA